ncbi:hypothetical protein PCO31110_02415 [Pandoraea communis]|uniref:Uncharacterized protein n=1 Tax=Pandoraea communis TaxID=2508297 RepID=A0A5E4V2N4_9BURK|nr:hypothetical protein PCO31110_02415 [Pandoraea communis]
MGSHCTGFAQDSRQACRIATGRPAIQADAFAPSQSRNASHASRFVAYGIV